mmetsp:Transcript_69365/g.157389  ORF Transcript_69365/g.157389 Transcript_69365/m.157389 type:complete len:242 (-) Transcript_69365:323-1048(-)
MARSRTCLASRRRASSRLLLMASSPMLPALWVATLCSSSAAVHRSTRASVPPSLLAPSAPRTPAGVAAPCPSAAAASRPSSLSQRGATSPQSGSLLRASATSGARPRESTPASAPATRASALRQHLLAASSAWKCGLRELMARCTWRCSPSLPRLRPPRRLRRPQHRSGPRRRKILARVLSRATCATTFRTARRPTCQWLSTRGRTSQRQFAATSAQRSTPSPSSSFRPRTSCSTSASRRA